MITVTVRLFAGQRDIVGAGELSLQVETGATVGSVWEQIVTTYPRLAGYTGRMLYAVNQEFSTLATPLHNGDELAFIPPVSGGSGQVHR
jgi:molybdopterin converting factor subunit 1